MFTLTYNSITIALPSPEFGDHENINYRKILNKTRGNEIILSGKIGYPYLASIKTYSYQFNFISEPLKQELFTFLSLSVGQVVSIVDYDDMVYQGLVMTPSSDIVQEGRSNNQITLEIQVIEDFPGNVIVIQGLNSNKLITQGYGP